MLRAACHPLTLDFQFRKVAFARHYLQESPQTGMPATTSHPREIKGTTDCGVEQISCFAFKWRFHMLLFTLA